MSLTSSRVDKGTTRFAPKLKARPARKPNGAPSASDESTPTPSTPSTFDQSAPPSSTFASTAAFDNQSNGSTTSTATGTPAGTPIVPPSTQFAPPAAPLSSTSTISPVAPLTSPRIGPKSPTFSATRPRDKVPTIASSSSGTTVSTAAAAPSAPSTPLTSLSLSSPSSGPPVVASSSPSSAGTAISIPGTSTKRSSGTAIDTPTSSNARKTSVSAGTKQASLISVPTTRPRHSLTGDQNDANGNGGSVSPSTPTTPASKRRASVHKTPDRGKKIARRRHQDEGGDQEGDHYYGEGGEEEGLLDEEDEDFVPDYSETPMFEFVRDMGAGRRSALYLEKERQWEQQREREREARKRRDAGLEEALENKGRFIKEATPKPQTPRTFGPKVRVVDGKMVLDEDSLQIDHAELEAPVDEGPMEYVEESASTTYINSTSYSTKNRAEKWTPRETELFYEALSQWGTDFGIIHKLFPSKSRIAVRNKFKREDRINKARVEAALTNKTPIDLEQYSKMSSYTFSDMTEEEILGNIQKEEEEKVKMMIKSEESQELEEPEPEPEPEPEEEILEEIVGTI